MKRAVGFVVLVALLGGAVWIGLASRPEPLDPTLSINCGFSLCDHEALVEPEVLIERCSAYRECRLLSYDGSVFFEFVGVSAAGGLRCDDGECGAADGALQSGWDPGTWRIEPRLPRSLRHLELVEPVEVELEAGESYDVEFVFRDPLKGWPRGPFGHNCFAENADGEGDFDGDGLRDRVEFSPGYAADYGFVGWSLLQRFGDARTVNQPIDAECPEVIGAVDIDGDGNDELFYDTGKGMTAALIDLMVYEHGKLREVIYRPKDTLLYVGGSNAGLSGLRCFRNDGDGGLVEVAGDPMGEKATFTFFFLNGLTLTEGATWEAGTRDWPRHSLECFGLRWKGY